VRRFGGRRPLFVDEIREEGLRAIACVADGDEQGAAYAYLDMLPGSLAVQRYAAHGLIGLDWTGDAFEIAAEEARAFPENPESYLFLGEISRELGHHAVTALAYGEALRLGAADEAGARAALGDQPLTRHPEPRH